MPPRRGKAQGGKDAADEAKPRPAAPAVSQRAQGPEGGSAWGRPRDQPAAAGRPPTGSAAAAAAKAKAAAKPPPNIAAQAARNLGGFVPNKIFVGGVPITCTEEQFRANFEVYGAISKVELHALRGFGYITYETVEAVDACLERYEDHYLSKKWVEVKRSIPRELIDAYEREQKRLQAEQLGTAEGDRPCAPVEAYPKVDPAPAPAAAPTSTSAWGMPAPSVARRPPGSHASGAAKARESGSGGTVNLGRIAQLREMGFSDEVARRVLSECAWDVNAAIDRLLLSGAAATAEGEADGEAGDGAGSAGDSRAVAEPSHEAPPKAAAPAETEVRASSGAAAAAGTGAAAKPQDQASVAAAQEPVAPATAAHAAHAAQAAEDNDVQPEAQDAEQEPAAARPLPPRKRIERTKRDWIAEEPSQLAVSEGDFVRVWVESQTENGWIHAECYDDSTKVGWLPAFALQELQPGQRWMRASQDWQARDEMQCSVQEGGLAIVWTLSKTAEGWTYAEALKDGAMQGGWLPVFCLDWEEE